MYSTDFCQCYPLTSNCIFITTSTPPPKVKAIVDMANPTDVPGVQLLLGLAQYLAIL